MMKLIEVPEGQRRDDCVALMCAEVFGHNAGLKPLLCYTAMVSRLLPDLAARVVALADGEKLCSVALLVLEEEGKAASLELLTTPASLRGKGYARELLERLTSTTAMRVTCDDPRLQGFFTTFGFSRWLDNPNHSSMRIGLNARHPAQRFEELDALVSVDEAVIIRTFKRDANAFEQYTQRFVEGVERSKEYFHDAK